MTVAICPVSDATWDSLELWVFLNSCRSTPSINPAMPIAQTTERGALTQGLLVPANWLKMMPNPPKAEREARMVGLNAETGHVAAVDSRLCLARYRPRHRVVRTAEEVAHDP
jgi:hypothetical protein